MLLQSRIWGGAARRCYRKWRHFPALLSYHSSSSKCTIAHDSHGYRMRWKSRDSEEGFPWVRVQACATGSCAISDQTSPVGLPLKLEVMWSEVSLGCYLGHPRPICSMATRNSPFTGYLLLSRHFIFMGSAFNNGFRLRFFGYAWGVV